MALADILTVEQSKQKIAPKNRVAILLDTVLGTPDHATLITALQNPQIKHSVLTRALQQEYGEDSVKPSSVREYRLNGISELRGL